MSAWRFDGTAVVKMLISETTAGVFLFMTNLMRRYEDINRRLPPTSNARYIFHVEDSVCTGKRRHW